jgi:L-ascorbate metabolism protein UlaG (beta-lactamase superfamily)
VKLIKFNHSCVRLEDGASTLVIDPGAFSTPAAALTGADGVLVTHEHADHIDVDALLAAAAESTALRVWAPASLADALAPLGDRFTAVGAGEEFDAVGFGVSTVGGQHALIHPLVPIVSNVGYVVNGVLYHPGDSFIVPPTPVDTVLVPIHAPWSKVGEVIDFIVATHAKQSFQIHDGLLNATGLGMVEGMATRFAGVYGSSFDHLDTSDSVELG